MSTRRFLSSCAAWFLLSLAAMPASAQADRDACTLLTPAEVGAAVGVAVTAGSHVTPTYVKTCTWNVSGSSNVKTVTLFLQTAASYDSGKKLALQMAAATTSTAFKAASVGDDGYYFVAGDQVGLLVKKGGLAFKVAVYATLPVDRKQAMELALARNVVAKL